MTRIRVFDSAGEFAGDKDEAARLREEKLRPALLAGESVVLDFEGVGLATQSFIHALVSDLVRKDELHALDLLTFGNCNASVQGVIEIVAEYSQEDVSEGAE